MTALVTASGNYRATAASSIDRAIRLSTAAAVLAVAGIAACVSYWHAYAVVRAYGGSGITARLEPATIDGLVYASGMFSGGHPGCCMTLHRATRRLVLRRISSGVVLVAGRCSRRAGERGSQGAGVHGAAAVRGAVLDGAG